MIVVSNATPLIGLAMADEFDLLRDILGEIHIPRAVLREVVEEGEGRFGAREVEQASWIHVVDVEDRLAVEVLEDDLGEGESETIVLAREIGAERVLVDERLARRKLKSLGVEVIGTLGVLLMAKEQGLLQEITPQVNKLLARGFRISRATYEEALRLAGELVDEIDRERLSH